MQGRPDEEKSATSRLAALNGVRERRGTGQGTSELKLPLQSTSELRAIPKRPQNMPPHLTSRPEAAPRAPRPQRQSAPPRRTRRFFIVAGTILAIFAIIIFTIIFLVVNAVNQSTGPTATAGDFLKALSAQNYDGAYQDLGPAVIFLHHLDQQGFKDQVKALDDQYGKITDYQEVEDSATVQDNTRGFTYTITRTNPNTRDKPITYKLTLKLQQNPDANNNWQITDYGASLGPTQ